MIPEVVSFACTSALSTLRASFPVLGNPLNRDKATALTHDQFHYAFKIGTREAFAGENLAYFFSLTFGRDFDVAMFDRLEAFNVIVLGFRSEKVAGSH